MVVVIPDISALSSPSDKAESRREGPQNQSATSGYEGVCGLKSIGVRIYCQFCAGIIGLIIPYCTRLVILLVNHNFL